MVVAAASAAKILGLFSSLKLKFKINKVKRKTLYQIQQVKFHVRKAPV